MRYRFGIATFALLTTLLSGCMVGPDFRRPAPPETRRYTAGPLPQKTQNVAAHGQAGKAQYFAAGHDIPAQWWKLFHSPALNRLIRAGLDNSPNLTAAKAALTQAQENFNAQMGASLLPNLSFNLPAQRQRFSSSLFGIPAPANVFNLYNPMFNITYTLDVFGGARRQLEALCAQANYQRYQLEAAYLTLSSNIATVAITAASLEAQITATRALLRYQEKTLQIIEQQFHLGGTSEEEVLSQRTLVAQTRATLPPLQQSLAKNYHLLAVLTGSLPSEAKIPALNLDAFRLPTQLPLSLPSSLARQRPDIQASEALLHAASAQIGVATANLYPQINITGGYGWINNTLANLFSPNNAIWNAGIALAQPLYNGGSLRAKRRAAVAAYEQAMAQYRQTLLQAFANVADTLRAIQNDAQTFRAQSQAEEAANRNLGLTRRQFKLGGVNYLSLLDAERQYQQTKINRIQAQAARFTDTVALFQALGGGWWNRGPAEVTHAS